MVLASGEGTNLQALVDGPVAEGVAELAGVGSDKPESPALQRGEAAGAAVASFPLAEFPDREARDLAMADWIESRGADLIVLAGYMALLTPSFIVRFRNRIVNVHPSLLPLFPGLDAIGQALEAGAPETGVTVHFVDEGVDTGPVLLQRAVAVPESRKREDLESVVHRIEHELLPEAVSLIAAGRVAVSAGENNGGARVEIAPA